MKGYGNNVVGYRGQEDMQGFGFTDTQTTLRTEAIRFARKELAPGAKERAKRGKYMAPPELLKKFDEVGWLRLKIPAKYGGREIDYVSIGILVEEIAKVDHTLAMTPAWYCPIARVMALLPDETQDRWLPLILSGEKIHSWAFTEPDTGSDIGAIKTKATRDGDCYVISGEKSPITMGVDADIVVVAAKTDMNAGIKGITLFLVPLELPGISKSEIRWMGELYPTGASITFDQVSVDAKYRIGEEGKGIISTMAFFQYMRPMVTIGCLGAAEASLNEAMAWAKQRVIFGKPIIKYDGISFKIAEHHTLVEAAKLLCYRALWLMDHGLPSTKESSMAKWLGTETAVHAIHDAMMVFGYIGYSDELVIEQRLRGVIGMELGEGANNIHKLIVARDLMGNDALPY
jgi:cyclohexanecarboxyl-CoA dehydrogenase